MGTSAEDAKLSGTFLMAPRVPQGLAAAVEGLTREVLRHRPEDIYVFAAHHFEKLLKLREEYHCGRREQRSSKHDARTLRELNERIRSRDNPYVATLGDKASRSGWSLNETVKVLEKYRSAFGDEEATASIEEARALASKGDNLTFKKPTSRSSSKSRSRSRSRNDSRQEFSQSHRGGSSGDEMKAGLRHTSKVISQIPTLPGSTEMLTKDIKSELRRNKISSREKKHPKHANGPSLEDSMVSRKAFPRRPLERTKHAETDKNFNVKRNIETKENGLYESSGRKKSSRALSMDRVVKDYAVGRFAATKSLEELQSAKYVEKVQEVIDQTAPIIRDKVEELKSATFGRSRRTRNSEETLSGKSERRSLAARKNSEIESRPNDSMDGIDTLDSESVASEPPRDTLEARLNATQHLLQDISTTCSQNSKIAATRRPRSAKNGRRRTNGNGTEVSAPETSPEPSTDTSPQDFPKVSLPAVRPPSSKNSKDASRSDSDALVLPPISPETSKSSKKTDELVLPALSRPTSAGIAAQVVTNIEETKQPDDSARGKDQTKKQDSEEEVFRDSLNVTPDVVDAPQRPDSLEPEDVNEDIRGEKHGLEDQSAHSKDEANINIEDKLRELEDAEKRIAGILNQESSKQLAEETTGKGTTVAPKNEGEEPDSLGNSSEQQEMTDDTRNVASAESSKDSRETEDNSDEDKRTDIPFSYVLSEGSPCEIPESVTTVIIPDRTVLSPESDTLEVQSEEDGKVQSSLISNVTEDNLDETKLKSAVEAFGEYVKPDPIETSTVDIHFIHGIKTSHDFLIARQDLDQIQEEDDKEIEEVNNIIGREEKTSNPTLEDILENEENEDANEKEKPQMEKQLNKIEMPQESNGSSQEISRFAVESDSTDETKETSLTDGVAGAGDYVENSLEAEESTEIRSSESSNEVKETTVSDRSIISLSLDPERPIVPELNLDSLQDITISSFRMTDDEMEKRDSDDSRRMSEENATFSDQCTSEEKKLTTQEVAETCQGLLQADNQTANEESTLTDEVPPKCASSATLITSPTSEEKLPAEFESKIEKQQEGIVDRDDINDEEIARMLIEIDRSDSNRDVEATSQLNLGEGEVDEVPDKSTASERNEDQPKEVVEDPIIKRQVEIKEDPCEKTRTFVTEIHDRGEEALDAQRNGQFKVVTKELSDGTEVELSMGRPHGRQLNSATSSVASGDTEICDSTKDKEEITITADVDEHNPLAVSRSASQCTTRRVSSAKTITITDDEQIIVADELTSPKINDNQTEKKDENEEKVDENGQGQTVSEELMISATAEIMAPRSLSEVSVPSADVVNEEKKINEEKEDHVFVAEKLTESADEPSTSESSTLNSAATKIQAGVRGFLTRRRLQSTEPRASTLDSLPSIPDGLPANLSASVEDKRPTSLTAERNCRESKARQRFRREDAVQRATISMEKPFAENGLQHTGEFHDCLPLPVLELGETSIRRNTTIPHDQGLSNKTADSLENEQTEVDNTEENSTSPKEPTDEIYEQFPTLQTAGRSEENKIFLGCAAIPLFHLGIDPNAAPFLDFLAIAKDESALQNRYLNFITSVEDAEPMRVDDSSDVSAGDTSIREPLALPGPRQGVIIEELTSLADADTLPSFQESSLPAADAESTPEEASNLANDSTNFEELEKIVKEGDNVAKGESEPERESPCSLDDERAFLESSPISLEDPCSLNVSRVSSARASNRSKSLQDAQQDSTLDMAMSRKEDEGNQPSFDSAEDTKDTEPTNNESIPPEASLSTLSFSMDIDDALGLGSQHETSKEPHEPSTMITSQLLPQPTEESQERHESPITTMQIVPENSVDNPNNTSAEKETEKITSAVMEEAKAAEVKEQQSPKKSSSSERSSVDVSAGRISRTPTPE